MGLFDKKENEKLKIVKDAMLSKFPSLGATCSKLKFSFSKKVPTAATDGENVFVNPDFFEAQSHDLRVAVLSHEVMHVAFNHIRRQIGKDGKERAHSIWNLATDAVINDILKNNGLPISENWVNMPGASEHSADEMYEQLYQKALEEQKQKQKAGKNQQQMAGGSGMPQTPPQSQPQQNQGQNGQQADQDEQEGQEGQEGQNGQNGQNQQNGKNGQKGQQGGQEQDGDQQSEGQQGQRQAGQSGAQNQAGQQNGITQGGKQNGQGQQKNVDDKMPQQAGQQDGKNKHNKGEGISDLLDDDEQVGHDDHDIWKDALKKELKREEEEKKKKEKERAKAEKNKNKKKDQEENNEENQDEQNEENETNGLNYDKNKVADPDEMANAINGDGSDEEEDETPSFEETGRAKGEKPENDKGNDENDDGDSQEQQEKFREAMEKLEKEFTKMNDELKKETAIKIRKSIEEKNHHYGTTALNGNRTQGEVGEDKPILSWKKILAKEFKKDEARWSYRRSSRDNFYMPRIEEIEQYEQSVTEVVLDTSGSIDDALLKGFLRQLKPLVKETKLKAGCFDTMFYGFKELKTKEDIDNFKSRGGGGTDLDCAVRAFTNDKKVNKIVFTDGISDDMPKRDLYETKNLIWVVFDNPRFKAPFGKIVYVKKSEMYTQDLMDKQNSNTSYSNDDEDEFDM